MRSTKMHLDLSNDIHAVLAVHHIDGEAAPSKTSRAANPVKVRVVIGVATHVHREVKVDHQRHLFHIDAS